MQLDKQNLSTLLLCKDVGIGSAVEYTNLVVQAVIFEKLSIFFYRKDFQGAIALVEILLKLSKFTNSLNLVNTKVTGPLHFDNHLETLYQDKSLDYRAKNEGI